MNKYIPLITLIVVAGCSSIQRNQYISTTSNLENPHAIMLVGKQPKVRSAVPVVLSINDEMPGPYSFGSRFNDIMWGNATYHYRVPTGNVRVKAYFPRNNSGGFIGGYLDAKDRENAPIYGFIAEPGLVYRAVANPHKQSVLIINEKSGAIVAPTFENIIPLLKSGDYADTRNASKTVYLEAMQASKELADAYADIINAYLSKPDEDELAVDAMAWACKAIGSAKITDNINEIEKLIAADINAKIIEHAKKALEAIKN